MRTKRAFVWAAAACAATVGIARAEQPPAKTQPATEPAQADSATTANRLLSRAASAGEAALAWLERQAGAAEQAASDGRASLASAEARLRAEIDEAMARAAELRRPGVRVFDPSDTKAPWTMLSPGDGMKLPTRVVLFVPGLDDPGTIFATAAPALAEALSKAGSPARVARLEYPNDQPLRASGDLLATALRDLTGRGVERVDLVGHSMGGLLVRDVLTRGEHYAGLPAPAPGSKGAGLPRVGRVIIAGTPNRGTALAPLRTILEAREQFVRWMDADGHDPAALLGFLHDGSGEAVHDLVPGSAYLVELNARPAPKWTKGSNAAPGPDEISITVVVGTLAGGSALEGVDLKPILGWPIVRGVLTEADMKNAVAAIDELGKVVGDGLVQVSSAELEGAEDTIYVEANHRSMLRPWVEGEAELPAAVRVIVERLGK